MNILHILSIETLRDGGSLIISFQADDSCQYWLMLPIKNLEVKSNNQNAVDYYSPVLVNRTTALEMELSWSSADACLHRLETYVKAGDSHRLLEKMQEIINTHID